MKQLFISFAILVALIGFIFLIAKRSDPAYPSGVPVPDLSAIDCTAQTNDIETTLEAGIIMPNNILQRDDGTIYNFTIVEVCGTSVAHLIEVGKRAQMTIYQGVVVGIAVN